MLLLMGPVLTVLKLHVSVPNGFSPGMIVSTRNGKILVTVVGFCKFLDISSRFWKLLKYSKPSFSIEFIWLCKNHDLPTASLAVVAEYRNKMVVHFS